MKHKLGLIFISCLLLMTLVLPLFSAQSVFTDPSLGSCTDAGAANTGNGTCTVSSAQAFVGTETFTFTATTAGPTATFTVTGSVTGAHQPITSGGSRSVTDYYGFTKFTVNLSDGGTPYVIGDNFTMTATAGTELKKANFDLLTLTQICSNGCDATQDARVAAGTGSGYASVGGVLNMSTTDVGNVGSGEDDLQSYTIPANTLTQTGDGVTFTAFGTTAANANNKTIKVVLNGSTIYSTGALALNNIDWVIRGECYRASSSVMKCVVTMQAASTLVTAALSTDYTETNVTDFTSTRILKITGEATSDGDITNRGFRVELKPL